MDTPANPSRVTIYGLGNVGLAFAKLFEQHGFSVTVTGRELNKVRKQAALLDRKPNVKVAQEAVANADLVLLSVTDSAIRQVSESLSPYFKENSIVTHCSGALNSTELSSAKSTKSVAICSLHPLNTFPSASASIDAFSGSHKTTLYAEGDRPALDFCNALFVNLGFELIEIDSQAKVLYHAACVMASNYLVALMESSLATAESAGIKRDQFWQSLQPILNSTLSNISKFGTEAALSGPIVRADARTVEAHLRELAMVDQNLQSTYANLGLRALELASTGEDLTPEQIEQIAQVLNIQKT